VFFASSCTLAKVADSSAVDADGELCFMTHKSLIQLVESMAASVVFTTLVSLKTITSTTQLNFWACIHKTYSSPYAIRPLYVLSVCPVCNIGVLWPNSWMDQDKTWHAGRPRPWPHCVRWGPSSPSSKMGRSPPIFGPNLLWPNGWMDQHATWQGGRPQPKRHSVR